MMQAMNKDNIKITGEWDGEPIWREKTPEEKLQEVNVSELEALASLAVTQPKL